MLTASCRLPCVANVADELPGVIPDVLQMPQGASDSSMVTTSDETSAEAGEWTELVPMDANRINAGVTNTGSDSVFIMPYNSGFPADGTQPAEWEVAPGNGQSIDAGFSDLRSTRRWIIRGAAASVPYDVSTW